MVSQRNSISVAALGRVGLTLTAFVYCLLRFGGGIGLRLLPAAAAILLLEVVRFMQSRNATAAAFVVPVAAALQPVILLVACFAPAPFGLGSLIPGRVMMDTQVFVLVLCFLASNADAERPSTLWASGGAIFLAWLAAGQVMLSDPHAITAATMHASNYKTPLAFLTAQNDPHFFNFTMFRGSLVSCAMITAALGFGLYRTRRLARSAADAQLSRGSLAAWFAPAVVDEILKSRGREFGPREAQVAALDCDLVGFTAMAEQRVPEEVAAVLSAWRSVVEDAVFAHGGTILSHAGDGSIALFGLAGGEEHAATGALAAAQQILRAWPVAASTVLNAPPLAIGLDFGFARAGLLGERMLSFVAAGPVLDSAAELQRETRTAGAAVLVSEAAFARITRYESGLARLFERYENDAMVAWKLKTAEPRG
jgi:adenylate cyclase